MSLMEKPATPPAVQPKLKAVVSFDESDFEAKAYGDLSTSEMVKIRTSLEHVGNREGMKIEDLKEGIFVMFPTGFMIFNVITHRSGKEFFLTWIDGKHLFNNRLTIWSVMMELARKFECVWLGATMRRKSAYKIFKDLGVKLDYNFMTKLEKEDGQ